MDVKDEARALVSRRREAYCQVFGGPVGQKVLADLSRFCRGNESCFDADPRIHALIEGRREVFLRITRYLNLSPEELFKLYGLQE